MKISVRGVESAMSKIREAQATIARQKEVMMHQLVASLAAATPVDTGEAAAGWKVEDGRIINEVEHIGKLNEGSSRQAPAHFVEHTVLASPIVMPRGAIVEYF